MALGRQRQIDNEDLNKIPKTIREELSEDSTRQLADMIKDYEVYKKPQIDEVAYAGDSRVTGYSSSLNHYRNTGYYSTTDIPLNVLDLMRRDSQVALGMSIVKYPITNLGFTVNCENPIIKSAVKYMLKRIWSKMLRDMLLSLDYGFVSFEKVWAKIKLDIDPGKNQRKAKGKELIFLKKLKPLHPTTVSLELDDLNNIVAVKQVNFGKKDVTLDKTKHLHFIYQEEFGNLFGKSRMASAYEPWYWKTISTQFFLRWMERHSIPPYKVLYPNGKTITRTGEVANAEIAMKMAQAVSSYGNITVPSKRDENGNLIWDIEGVNQSSQSLTLKEVIEEVWNVAIMRGLLIPDEKSIGGLNKDIATQIFISTLGDFVELAQNKINEEIVKPFVYWNFSKEERQECFVNIDDIDFQKREEMRKLLSKVLDTSATFIKQLGGLPFNIFPDLEKILETLDIPSKPIGLYQLKTFDPDGKEVDPKKVKPNSKKNSGPDKGQKTPGNQSRTGRDGTPRDDDKTDESVE